MHWIHARSCPAIPATIAVFPSDHFVIEEDRFMRQVSAIAAAAGHNNHMVVLGTERDTPDSDYGWIEPGEVLEPLGPVPLAETTGSLKSPPPPKRSTRSAPAGSGIH